MPSRCSMVSRERSCTAPLSAVTSPVSSTRRGGSASGDGPTSTGTVAWPWCTRRGGQRGGQTRLLPAAGGLSTPRPTIRGVVAIGRGESLRKMRSPAAKMFSAPRRLLQHRNPNTPCDHPHHRVSLHSSGTHVFDRSRRRTNGKVVMTADTLAWN